MTRPNDDQELDGGLDLSPERPTARLVPVRNVGRSSAVGSPGTPPKKASGRKTPPTTNGKSEVPVPPAQPQVPSSKSSSGKVVAAYFLFAIAIIGVIFLVYEGNLKLEANATNTTVGGLGLLLGIVLLYQRWFTQYTTNGLWVGIHMPTGSIKFQMVKIDPKKDQGVFTLEGKIYIIKRDCIRYYQYAKYLPKIFHARVPFLQYFWDDPEPILVVAGELPPASATELADFLDPREAHMLAEATQKFQERETGRFSMKKIVLMGFVGVILLQLPTLYFSTQIKSTVEAIQILVK